MSINKRIGWIDTLRGLSMLAILLFHTEVYYTGSEIISYNMYVTNALTVFFVISGYLMYKPREQFCIGHKLRSIIKGLLLPYFVFTTLMALPKALAHGVSVKGADIFLPIITGEASWFVAALCLSEALFALSIYLTRGKLLWLLLISAAGFGASVWLSNNNIVLPWQIANALQALLFLFMGYTYHQFEQKFGLFGRIPSLICAFALLALIKVYEQMCGVSMLICPIHINNYTVFLIDVVLCALFMVHLCQRLPQCRWLAWTGRHSLVYYFLCGGVPLLVSRLFCLMGFAYRGNYLFVITAFVLVYAMTTASAWLIYRYVPQAVGKW